MYSIDLQLMFDFFKNFVLEKKLCRKGQKKFPKAPSVPLQRCLKLLRPQCFRQLISCIPLNV